MLAAISASRGAARIGRQRPASAARPAYFEPIDTFDEAGSFFAGVQAGYNYMLPEPRRHRRRDRRDHFQAIKISLAISIGGTSNFTSPTLGSLSYSETMLAFGTARARIGYAPGSWLFYATGGFAWTYNQQSLTQLSTGNSESPFLWRLGWAAGAGVETPIAPHWTSRLEYLFTDYGSSSYSFSGGRSRSVRISRCRSCAPASAISSATMRRQPTPHLWSRRRRLGRIPTTSAFTARPRSFGRGILHSDRRIRASKVCPAAARAVRPWTVTLFAGVRLWQGAQAVGRSGDRSGLRSCGHARRGRIPERRSPTSSASPIPTRASSVISSGRRSILAARPRRWTPTSVSSPARRRPTAWC